MDGLELVRVRALRGGGEGDGPVRRERVAVDADLERERAAEPEEADGDGRVLEDAPGLVRAFLGAERVGEGRRRVVARLGRVRPKVLDAERHRGPESGEHSEERVAGVEDRGRA